jgi:hypothetical protein
MLATASEWTGCVANSAAEMKQVAVGLSDASMDVGELKLMTV